MARINAWVVAASCAIGAACMPAGATTAQSRDDLATLVTPRAADLRAAGIQRISARAAREPLSIQVLTTSGPIYFAWPANVAPAPFVLEEARGGSAYNVRAEGGGDAARYAAAFDAVIPEAVRRAQQNAAWVNRIRP
jgi:hypothetical protein